MLQTLSAVPPGVVIIVVTLAVLIVTETFYPTDAKRQRHFWAVVLTALSMVFAFTVTSVANLHGKIGNVSTVFAGIRDRGIEEEFREIYRALHERFRNVKEQSILDQWAHQSIEHLRSHLANGYVVIPRNQAAQTIELVYPQAREFIFATNVGGTAFYFDHPGYMRRQRAATAQGVPIVRFYLFSPNKKIELGSTGGQLRPHKIEEFAREVEMLHEGQQTLLSAVIRVDATDLQKPRDLLLVDNFFLAETDLDINWQPVQAKATHDSDALRLARDYFRDLEGVIDQRYLYAMDDDMVRKWFHDYHDAPDSERGLAWEVFQDLMEKITR